jgi:hypothetical protein
MEKTPALTWARPTSSKTGAGLEGETDGDRHQWLGDGQGQKGQPKFAGVERTLRQEPCDGTGDEQRVRLPARKGVARAPVVR